MSKVLELFGHSAGSKIADWPKVVAEQHCPFINKRCYKVRKSDPGISIGSCTVMYSKESPQAGLVSSGRGNRSSAFKVLTG